MDAKSLDFADEDTGKAYQDALQVERAAAKRVPEIAQGARTKQIERQRPVETETSVPMEEDTETPISMEEDESRNCWSKVSKKTWRLSNHAGHGMMGVAEHHLDLASSAEEAGRLRAEGYRSLWTPAKPTGGGGTSGGTLATTKFHWKSSRFLEGYGDLVEPLKRSDSTPFLLAF